MPPNVFLDYSLIMNASAPLPQHSNQVSDQPCRLDLWLSKLTKLKLPIDEKIALSVKAELSSPDTDSERLTAIIKQDPALCLRLFLHGQQRLKHREGDIQGMVHLLGLLGLNQITAVIDESETVNTLIDDQRALFAASMFAAQLAENLLPYKHGTRGSTFYLPSLLFNAPLWLMWVAAPKVMTQLQREASEQRKPLKDVCQNKLGFTLQSIFTHSKRFLALPDLTHKAHNIDLHNQLLTWATIHRMEKDQTNLWFEKDKTVKHLFCSADTGIFLINQYVLAVYLDQNGKHTRRWGRLLSRHMGISEKQLKKRVTAIAQQTTLPSQYDEQFYPLFRNRKLHLIGNIQHNKPINLNQYLKQIENCQNLDKCLELTADALIDGAQVEHYMVLTIANGQLELPVHYGFDTSIADTISIDHNKCGQLLKALMLKPMAITIEKEKLALIKKQLPTELSQYWGLHPCGFMSLFKSGEPYAIIICDHSEWNDQKHEAFKAIGKQLNRSLRRC